jgi:hypothetical protein
MKYNHKKFVYLFTISFGLFLFGKIADAASIYLSPSEQIVSTDSTFIIDVLVDSDKEIINAIKTQITYPTDYLEVIDLNYGDSFLTLWPEQPNNESQNGIINFTGGTPEGSYVFDAKALSITFRAKRAGLANINFVSEKTSIHLNDGKGTSLKTDTGASNLTITAPSSQAIIISSPSHPDQDRWYSENDFIVSWEPRLDSFYSYLLTTNPKAEPDETQEIETGKVTFEDLADGIYYFILSEKPSGEVWQPAGIRRVMIDQTPPLPFEIQLTDNSPEFKEKKAIVFSTSDAMSGIDHYDLLQGDKLFKNITSPYLYQIDNPTDFIVRAYDKAGNQTEAKKLVIEQHKNNFSNFAIMLIVIIVLLIIILFIVLRSRSKDEERPQSE